MQARWGSNGKFGTWKTYWQDFTPAVGMCVEGVYWGGDYGQGTYTQATCEADGASRAFFTARRFEEGRWDTVDPQPYLELRVEGLSGVGVGCSE